MGVNMIAKNKERIIKSIKKVQKSEKRLKIKKLETLWIQQDSKIHLLNYLYYRYFTNEFELFVINFMSIKTINEFEKEVLNLLEEAIEVMR